MASRERLVNAVTVVITLVALASVANVVRREFWPQPAAAALDGPPPIRQVRDWRTYEAAGYRMGEAFAPVTIVEFSDFQCPFCRSFSAIADSVQQRYGGRVARVFRQFPLEKHPAAMNAARASICAGRQDRFKPMYTLLFAQQDSLGMKRWTLFASEAGVPDVARFETCMADPAVNAEIQADLKAGKTLGVTGTPTFLVNQSMVTGIVSKAAVDSLVQAEMRRASRD